MIVDDYDYDIILIKVDCFQLKDQKSLLKDRKVIYIDKINLYQKRQSNFILFRYKSTFLILSGQYIINFVATIWIWTTNSDRKC